MHGKGEVATIDLSAPTITVDNPALALGNTQITVNAVIGGSQRKYTLAVSVL